MFGPLTSAIYGKQDVAAFFEKAAGATLDVNVEGCPCQECIKARAEFDAWVEDVKRRWHNPDCGPACTEHQLTDYSGLVVQ